MVINITIILENVQKILVLKYFTLYVHLHPYILYINSRKINFKAVIKIRNSYQFTELTYWKTYSNQF